jgi:hypothetical protein
MESWILMVGAASNIPVLSFQICNFKIKILVERCICKFSEGEREWGKNEKGRGYVI